MNPYRAALLSCTAILSGCCLIPQFTGSFRVPVAYPWPGVLLRRWRVQVGKLNGQPIVFAGDAE